MTYFCIYLFIYLFIDLFIDYATVFICLGIIEQICVSLFWIVGYNGCIVDIV